MSPNSFYNLGILVKPSPDQQKVKCPNCPKVGKTHLNDTPLSVSLKDGVFNCHKCGWSGSVNAGQKKEFTRPEKKNFTKISDAALEFFTGRGITQSVVNDNKIVQEGEWIIFPYLRGGELVNVKKRSIKTKDFRQAAGAEAIIYNYDRVAGQKQIIVTEGELDCMAFEMAGFTNVTSVNQGAPNEKDLNVDKKLECITNCYEVFEQADVIYLAVDKDPNGLRLENELIRRFGQEKCKIVPFPECKDANEVLMRFGKEMLLECIKEAKDVKVTGIYTVEDVRESMLNSFENGKRRGETTHWQQFDANFTHRRGEVTVWTGYMNEGKSKFVKQLLLVKAKFDDWKTAVFSPEEFPPDEFYDDLIHSYIGKATDKFYRNVMGRSEYERGIDFIRKYFFYIYPENDFTWDSVEKKLIHLIRKFGIKAVVLDPYNQFDHTQGSQRDDLYIGKFMAILKRFALQHDVAVHLIAHQVTPVFINGQDYPQPNAYKVKGGGTFADKADNVGWVWRPARNTDKRSPSVTIGLDKIKNQRLVGEPGQQDWTFDKMVNRYYLAGYNPFDSLKEKQATLQNNEEFLTGIITDDGQSPEF